jgi:hypothetical protein
MLRGGCAAEDALSMKKRFGAFVERVSDRLGRSSSAFFVVLIVLCGIEVAVDWNATLYEINVLRGQLKQKAENYADLLRKAAEPAILAYDADELERLSSGVFEDDELVYVRFTDLLGNTLFDRLRPDFARSFAEKHDATFRVYYRRQMTRDTAGIANDPITLRKKMQGSRHRDFIQAFTDGENALFALFSKPPPKVDEPLPRVLYQDRLARPDGSRDKDTSYSVGSITAPDGEVYGVVLVAFRHDKLNRAVLGKLGKGLGIVLFFIGLILVQNVASRKSKLRLLNLEAAQKAAREAVRATVPAAPAVPWGKVGVALVQTDRVGGTIYDLRSFEDGTLELLHAVPEGEGVEAAFAAIELHDLHHHLEGAAAPADRARALLAAYDREPLGRPMHVLILRIAPDGAVDGVASLPPPSLLSDGQVRQIVAGEPLDVQSPRLRAPLRPFSAQLTTLFIGPVADQLQRGLSPQAAADAAAAVKKPKQDQLIFVATRSAA